MPGDAVQIPQPLPQGLFADYSPLLQLQHVAQGWLGLRCWCQRADLNRQGGAFRYWQLPGNHALPVQNISPLDKQ